MKSIQVYKHTHDDFYPTIKFGSEEDIDGGGLVFVGCNELEDGGFIVYACGNDDYGLEKVFSADQENHALCLFMEIIGMGTVEVDKLYELGMKGGL